MGEMPSIRKLYIMRHAERVDFCFGSWIPSSFDKSGNYIRSNLNMPLSVPKRKGGPMDFFKDCPLTRMGLHQATLTGEAMKLSGVTFSNVFSSNSLRCVETCTNVLKASGQTHLPIHIEPGLFEWLGWYVDGMPKWLTPEELSENGFKIVLDYKPAISAEDILQGKKESSEEYYMRNYFVTKNILEKYSGDILLVAHAASLDTCSRQLTGKTPRNEKDLLSLVTKFTYASVALVEEENNKWHLSQPPFPPLMHSNNSSFNWKILLD